MQPSQPTGRGPRTSSPSEDLGFEIDPNMGDELDELLNADEASEAFEAPTDHAPPAKPKIKPSAVKKKPRLDASFEAPISLQDDGPKADPAPAGSSESRSVELPPAAARPADQARAELSDEPQVERAAVEPVVEEKPEPAPELTAPSIETVCDDVSDDDFSDDVVSSAVSDDVVVDHGLDADLMSGDLMDAALEAEAFEMGAVDMDGADESMAGNDGIDDGMQITSDGSAQPAVDMLAVGSSPTDAGEPMSAVADEAMGAEDALDAEESAGADPFEGVPEPLAHALRERGFADLTAVQRAVVQAEGAGARDLRICSQTGSGKTVAIGLAVARALEEDAVMGGRDPLVLVVTPTRELAAQVESELDWLYANLHGVRTLTVTGGTSASAERRALSRQRPTVLVGTPGRLLDHARSGALDLGSVKQLVLDEADQMLDMGFRDELEAILEQLPEERRSILVSATFPAEVQRLVDSYQTDSLLIEGQSAGEAHGDIEHIACLVRGGDRLAALVNVLLLNGRSQRTLVFARTRQDTARLSEDLAGEGFSAMPLSGDLAQAQRTRTLNAFRNGTVQVLVATDVAARGIDVPNVSTVVQFEPPMDQAVYTHRSGRTGRAGKKGRNIIFAPPSGERRLSRMLHAAGVEASWRDAPSPAEVRKILDKRARSHVAALCDAEEPLTDELLAEARALLETRDPATVVARLLTSARPSVPCEPKPLGSAVRRTDRGRERGPRDDRRDSRRDDRRDRRDFERRDFGDRRERAPRDDGPKVRFSINWGRKSGANPKRILAHVCRRGDVQGRAIGAIDIQAHEATFDVDAKVAGGFARRASEQDPRDPLLVIRRLDAGGGGPRRRGRTA